MNHQLQKEIFYEIYPNSFMDSDGDGYGDFQGIIDRLDYVKDLGVTAIWLNPHYVSSWKDGGYDVVDHYHADERFGGDAGFEKLLQEVHKRGLKLIIDLVVGHTSEDNPLFCRVRQRKRARTTICLSGRTTFGTRPRNTRSCAAGSTATAHTW